MKLNIPKSVQEEVLDLDWNCGALHLCLQITKNLEWNAHCSDTALCALTSNYYKIPNPGRYAKVRTHREITVLFGNFSQMADPPHPPLLGTPYSKKKFIVYFAF